MSTETERRNYPRHGRGCKKSRSLNVALVATDEVDPFRRSHSSDLLQRRRSAYSISSLWRRSQHQAQRSLRGACAVYRHASQRVTGIIVCDVLSEFSLVVRSVCDQENHELWSSSSCCELLSERIIFGLFGGLHEMKSNITTTTGLPVLPLLLLMLLLLYSVLYGSRHGASDSASRHRNCRS